MKAALMITMALAGQPEWQTYRFDFTTEPDCERAKAIVLQANANANGLPLPGRQLTWPMPAGHVFVRDAHCEYAR